MTSPYYTATAGPADPKAGLRAKIYAVLAGLLGLLGVAQTFGVLDAPQSASIAQIITAVIALLGGGGLAVATAKTTTQVKNGTFDPAPEPNLEPITVSPAIAAVDGLAAVATGFNDLITTVTDGVQTVQNTVGNLASVLPNLPNVVSVLTPGSLAAQAVQAASGSPSAPVAAPVANPGS